MALVDIVLEWLINGSEYSLIHSIREHFTQNETRTTMSEIIANRIINKSEIASVCGESERIDRIRYRCIRTKMNKAARTHTHTHLLYRYLRFASPAKTNKHTREETYRSADCDCRIELQVGRWSSSSSDLLSTHVLSSVLYTQPYRTDDSLTWYRYCRVAVPLFVCIFFYCACACVRENIRRQRETPRKAILSS